MSILSFNTAKPEIIAHRGASHFAPENTLASFKLAWEKNADAIEGDFHITKDGKIICMHDPNTKRTTGVDLNIQNATYDQLKNLDAGAWKGEKWKNEKIPLLENVLNTIPDGKKIFLEIKCGTEIIPPLKALLNKLKINPDKITVISFNENVIAETKKQIPKLKTLLLISVKDDNGKISLSVADIIDKLKKINADGIDINAHPLIDKKFAAALKKNNFIFGVWTINDKKNAEKFIKLGADAITTDNPNLLD